MSYDLTFEFDDGGVEVGELRAHFSRRSWYDVEEGGARYLDGDTGVYFDFHWEIGDDGGVESLSFRLNFARPSIFGREAAIELEALVDAFEVEVDDPQTETDEIGFDAERFVDQWNDSNRRAIRRLHEQEGSSSHAHTVPREELTETWVWNHSRQSYQATLGREIFVPRIVYFDVDGSLEAAVIWPDGIPFALPDVDLLLITAPGLIGDSEDEASAVVDSADFHDRAGTPDERRTEPTDHGLYRWQSSPRDLVGELIDGGRSADQDELEGVSFDAMLDEKLVVDESIDWIS